MRTLNSSSVHREVFSSMNHLKNKRLVSLDMMQTNKRYGTRRPVRRRPKFVSSSDAQTIKTRYSIDGDVVLLCCWAKFGDGSKQDLSVCLGRSNHMFILLTVTVTSTPPIQHIFLYFSKRMPNNQSNFKALPGHWDKGQTPDTGFKVWFPNVRAFLMPFFPILYCVTLK